MLRIRRVRYFVFAFLVGGAVQLPVGEAHAVGFGAYFEYGRAWGTFDGDSTPPDLSDYDQNQFGVGFALDTALARDRVFNYRLNVGYERIHEESRSGVEMTSNGGALSNTFGFGIVRTDTMRVWLGPALRLGFDVRENTSGDVWDFDFGGGPVLGVNFHLGDRVSLGLTGGYHYMYTVRFNDPYYFDNTYDNGQHLGFVRFTVFLRSRGDRFKARSASSGAP